jgi:hypothetical protein
MHHICKGWSLMVRMETLCVLMAFGLVAACKGMLFALRQSAAAQYHSSLSEWLRSHNGSESEERAELGGVTGWRVTSPTGHSG